MTTEDKSQYSLRQYLQESPIHGLNIAANAHSKVEHVTWLLLIGLCASLLIYDSISIISTYNSEPVVTNVGVTQNTTMNILQNAVVCVELDAKFVTDNLKFLPVEVDLAIELFERFNQKDKLTPTVNDTAKFPDLLLYVTYSMLAHMQANMLNFFGGFPSAKQILWGYLPREDNQSYVDPLINEAIYKVYHYTQLNKIDIETLYHTVGALMCDKLNVRVNFIKFSFLTNMKDHHTINPCTKSAITLVDFSAVCSRLYSEETSMEIASAVDTLSIDAKPQLMLNGVSNVGDIHVDLMGKDRWDRHFPSGSFTVNFNSHVDVSVSLLAQYSSLSTKRKQCADVAHKNFDCKNNCMGRYFLSTCKCWPLKFIENPLKPSNATSCGQAVSAPVNQTSPPYVNYKFTSCIGGTHNPSDPTFECKKLCLPDCETKTFLFNVVMKSNELGSPNETSVAISVDNFVFPYVVERLQMSANDFLAQFGGSIGLWMGGSILAFVHLLISLVKLIGVVRQWKKESTTNVGQIH